MNYDDLDHLDSLISEDIISEEEDCNVTNDSALVNLHSVDDSNELNSVSESFQFSSVEDDIEIESTNSPQITYESDSSHKSEPCQSHSNTVKQNSNLIRKGSISSIKNSIIPSSESNTNENVTTQTLKLPSSRAILPSKSAMLINSQRVEDYSMLENKINDSLLDMLQGKVTKTLPKTVKNYQTEEKEEESLKLITIFPSKNVEKTINLMVKGKTCRSKQLLNATEMRIVSRIVNQENMFGRKSGSYKNVYYDPESDTNIRYEVQRRMLTELSSNPNALLYAQKKEKTNPKSLIRSGRAKTGSDESKLFRNKIARPLFGRISRPPGHVNRDCKRLKYMFKLNNETNENMNTGGYSDCDTDEDFDMSDDNDESESDKPLSSKRLPPSKLRVTALSTCPTCHKFCQDDRRLAIHFKKYPDHKDDNILQRLLQMRKQEINYNHELCAVPVNTRNKDCTCSNSSQTNLFSKRNQLDSKLLTQRSRSPAVCIKEFLSRYGAKEIAKHAGPIVAEVMNSWEYLLLRGEKLKSGDGTLLISLLKELKVILAQIQTISSHSLEPLTQKYQYSSNTLTIGPKDVLQHVLGVKPGTYVISDSKSSPGISAIQEWVNSENPQHTIPSTSTSNSAAKLFNAVVAECLRDESCDMDSSTTELNQKTDANSQNMTVLVYNDPVTGGEADGHNRVPIFTSTDLPQPVVSQAAQPANNDVNTPLVLDFNLFGETSSSHSQLSRNTSKAGSTSVIEKNSRERDEIKTSNVALSLPSLTDDTTVADDTRNSSLDMNDILDFSLLE